MFPLARRLRSAHTFRVDRGTLVRGSGGPSEPAAADSAGLRRTQFGPLAQVEDGRAGDHTRAPSTVLPRIEQRGGALRLEPSEGGDRYRDLATLGKGAMGEVSLVEDRDIGRTVAVKRLLRGPVHAPALARFVDEIRLVGSLEHPNIVPIHDVGVDADGRYFFVMKHIDGETLEDVIERMRAGDAEAFAAYPMRRRIELVIGILRALEYAHERGIIHRDLKPANVMVGRHGEVVLMDWGIARPFGEDTPAPEVAGTPAPGTVARASETVAGGLIGTPMYMSPEQATGLPLGPASDLFSVGVLLHEFLSLRHRFEGFTDMEDLLRQVRVTGPPLTFGVFSPHPAQKETIPWEMTHFLRRTWALDPKDRWPSTTAMREELETILDGRCRVQCPTTLLKRSTSELARFVDRAPGVAQLVFYGPVLVALIWLAVWGVRYLLG